MDGQKIVKLLALSVRDQMPANFTGKVVVTLNFHNGTAASGTVTHEEGVKLGPAY